MLKNANPYLEDAKKFLHRATDIIVKEEAPETVFGILNSALGVERLLKAKLFSINPLYVFKNQDFKNTLKILYPQNLVEGKENQHEIRDKPDNDVYSFRASLTRCCAVSPTVSKHRQMLFWLSAQRDVIAHCLTQELEIAKCIEFLKRDYRHLVVEFANEFDVLPKDLLGPRVSKLEKVVFENETEISKKVPLLLKRYFGIWNEKKNVPGYVESKTKSTERWLVNARERDEVATELECPACKNRAIAFLVEGYSSDEFSHPDYFEGFFAEKIKCLFCGLEVSEYDILDYLKIQDMDPFEEKADPA